MGESKLTITGGTEAGRTLYTPEDREIRPMRGRVRQALFDQLEEAISGSRVMDAFAGTGALGLESLSRGASCAVFLDRSARALSLVRRNIQLLNAEKRSRVLKCDLLEFPLTVPDPSAPFDLIFITPPYRYFRQPDTRRDLVRLLELVSRATYINVGGSVIVESETGDQLGEPPAGLELTRQREFGTTELRQFRRTGNEN